MNSNVTTAAIIAAILSATVGAVALIDQGQPSGPISPPPAFLQDEDVTPLPVDPDAAVHALRTAQRAGLPECAAVLAWIAEQQPRVMLNVPDWDSSKGISLSGKYFLPTTLPQFITRYTATDKYGDVWECNIPPGEGDIEPQKLRR